MSEAAHDSCTVSGSHGDDEEDELLELTLGRRRVGASDSESEGLSDHPSSDEDEAHPGGPAIASEHSEPGVDAQSGSAIGVRSRVGSGDGSTAVGDADGSEAHVGPEEQLARRLQPFDVPTAGRFWLHDDRNEPAPQQHQQQQHR